MANWNNRHCTICTLDPVQPNTWDSHCTSASTCLLNKKWCTHYAKWHHMDLYMIFNKHNNTIYLMWTWTTIIALFVINTSSVCSCSLTDSASAWVWARLGHFFNRLFHACVVSQHTILWCHEFVFFLFVTFSFISEWTNLSPSISDVLWNNKWSGYWLFVTVHHVDGLQLHFFFSSLLLFVSFANVRRV